MGNSFPGEFWKPAARDQFAWLEDEWCYPTLPDFRTRFRVVNGVLQRQNRGRLPKPFQTEWWTTKVYISNRGVLRIWYDNPDVPGNIVTFSPGKTAEWRENERYLNDDGTPRSGHQRLVLSCARCTLSRDGMTYSCK